jgi:hypothetical protein
MLVSVLDHQKRPLMPTTPVKASILLKQGKARVVHKLPFTIRLRYATTAHVAPLVHSVDTGGGVLGSAVSDPPRRYPLLR